MQKGSLFAIRPKRIGVHRRVTPNDEGQGRQYRLHALNSCVNLFYLWTAWTGHNPVFATVLLRISNLKWKVNYTYITYLHYIFKLSLGHSP